MGLQQVLDALIAEGTPQIQVHLRHSDQPLGPGKIERIVQMQTNATGVTTEAVLYRILCPVMLQANQQSRPVKMILPVVFDGADLLMIYEEPLNADGEKAAITPGDSKSSGLIIPGRPRNG